MEINSQTTDSKKSVCSGHRMASSDYDSKRMEKLLQNFRMEDLKKLMEAFKKPKYGTKPVLMSRAMELVNSSPPPPGLERKIKQLFNGIPIKGWFPTKESPNYPDLMKQFWASKNAPLQPSPSSSGSGSNGVGNLDFISTMGAIDTPSSCTVGDVHPVNPSPCSELKMKEHPFHEVLSVIRKPTILDPKKQGEEIIFQLKLDQLREVLKSSGEKNPQVFVLLRFCEFNSTTLEQPDLFPDDLVAKINGRIIVKPVEPIGGIPNQSAPKPFSRPLEIPSHTLDIHAANIIQLQWKADPQKSFCCSVYLTRKLSAENLLENLLGKPRQAPDVSKELIKKITTKSVNSEVGDVDVFVPKSIRVPLICPLSKIRITYPCRGINCQHLHCFDAKSFLQMNERTIQRMPKFSCPVCNAQLKVSELCLDGYFTDVLSNLSVEAGNVVEVFPDGSWRPAPVAASKKRNSGCDGNAAEPPFKKMKPTDKNNRINTTIDLMDDDGDDKNDIIVVEQRILIPKTKATPTITSPIPLPWFPVNGKSTKGYDTGASEAVKTNGKCFVASFQNGLGLGKENEIYLDID